MMDRANPVKTPRIDVRGVQYGWFLLDLVYNLLGSSPASAKSPRVVAIDRYGNERIVEECASKREASRTAVRLRAELDEVGARAWSMKRDLPGSFW